MDELVPVLLAAVLGTVIWMTTNGKLRLALSVAAVILSGGGATIASGEYHESWIYLLLDSGEAALGLALGYLIAARFLMPGMTGRNTRVKRDGP